MHPLQKVREHLLWGSMTMWCYNCFQNTTSNTIYVVDEIGKMELFSEPFKHAVQNLLQIPDARVIATIPISREGSQQQRNKQMLFIDEIREIGDDYIIGVKFVTKDENSVVISFTLKSRALNSLAASL